MFEAFSNFMNLLTNVVLAAFVLFFIGGGLYILFAMMVYALFGIDLLDFRDE